MLLDGNDNVDDSMNRGLELKEKMIARYRLAIMCSILKIIDR